MYKVGIPLGNILALKGSADATTEAARYEVGLEEVGPSSITRTYFTVYLNCPLQPQGDKIK